MSDTFDHDSNGNGNGYVGEPSEPPRDSLREAQQLVPVGPRGVNPATLADQITYAQMMAKASEAVPQHLRQNPGACLAVIDIALRTGLSPYMVANKTYVQSGRLAFESQLVVAMIEKSGELQGRLRHRYEGEIHDGTRRCIVWGTLKGESTPHEHIGGMLRDLHPGHKEKDGKKFVLGSQLWDRKPDVQLFYDTARDWGRMNCPQAMMGVYAPEEYIEHIEHQEETQNVLARLPGKQAGEGFNHAAATAELDQIVGNAGPDVVVRERKPHKIKDVTPPPKTSMTAKPEHADPKTAEEYQVYAESWIGRTKSFDNAVARWDGEKEMRAACKVPLRMRKALENKLAEKFGDEKE